jgi:RimJ/RimL family protein N-acetyltransferase
VIRTERLLLRPLEADDLAPLHQIMSDPRAMRFWDRPAYTSLDETRALLALFMADAPDRHLEYAVEADGRFIGRVGMWKPHEIGYIFSPAVWGRGFAFEATFALIEQVWARYPDAACLTAEVDPRNAASIRLLHRLGFGQTRVEEKNFLYGETEWCDTAYFELPRPQSCNR